MLGLTDRYYFRTAFRYFSTSNPKLIMFAMLCKEAKYRFLDKYKF